MKRFFSNEDICFEYLSLGRPLDSFNCTDTDDSKQIERFLKEDAMFYHQEGLVKVVLAVWDEIVIGYFALAMGKIYLSWGKKRKHFDREISIEIPALLIARMGVHDDFRGKKIGSSMMAQVFSIADDVSEKVGFRFIYVDSKPQSVGFYSRLGFEENRCSQYNERNLVNMTLDFKTMKA